MSDRGRYVSVKKFSEDTGIPEKTVRDWIRRRKIPSAKLNGRRVIDLERVEEQLKRDEEPPDGAPPPDAA